MSAKVLIVDDESVTRRIVAYTLQKIGIESVDAVDGMDALSRAENEYFDLAIVDINLPNMDGFEVTRRLKQLDASLPVVIFTARNEQSDELRAMEVGAVGFLYKPFSTQELRELVQSNLRA